MSLLAVTVKDVAQHAGVSVATVSKFMNGGNLREEYRLRVQAAVEELNYSINEVARNLKTNRSYAIGILSSTICSGYITTTISAIQRYLLEKGYISLITDYQGDRVLQKKQLDMLLRQKVDGIILFPDFNEIETVNEVRSHSIPIILVDNLIDGLSCDAVITNSCESAYAITNQLIRCHHTRIAFCAGPTGLLYTARERLLGYQQAMNAHGLQPLVFDGYYLVDGGYNAVKSMMALKDRPTAIISSNYDMTVGVLQALNELDVRIPEDISVAAFDKLDFDCVLQTPISTIVQPLEEIGVCAAKRIISRIEQKETTAPSVDVLPTKILYTQSIKDIG